MTRKPSRRSETADNRNHPSNYGRATVRKHGENGRSHNGYAAVQLLQAVLEMLPSDKKVVVLVVDSEPIARDVFSKTLVRCGYTVLEATDSDEAIAICEGAKDAIALLVTEIALCDGKGTQLAAKVREHCPNAAVVISSGLPIEYWTTADRERLAYLGERVEVLKKPFPIYALDSTVGRLLPAG